MKKNMLKSTGVWIRKSIKPFIVIAIVAVAVYWVKFAPVAVEQYQVKRGEIINEVMGTGTLDAKTKMIISSEISGRIDSVLVDQGDKVIAGQLVATLDDDQLKLQVDVAQANLKTVESAVKKYHKDLEFSKSVLNNAVKIYERHKSLIDKKVISQEQYDKAAEDLGTANATNSRVEASIIEAENKVTEAKNVLKLRRAQLEDSQICVPFDGIITKRDRDPGNIVIPGTAILSLISTKVLWVRAWVGETELAKIKEGQTARIIFRSEPGREYPGKVARIAIEVDKETREFIVDINVDKLPENWAIDQRAEVYIETEKKENAVVIPQKYIKWQDNKPGVFVDNGGSALWKPVKTGVNGGDFIEITEGVQEGDTVISAGDLNLKNGIAVKTARQ